MQTYTHLTDEEFLGLLLNSPLPTSPLEAELLRRFESLLDERNELAAELQKE